MRAKGPSGEIGAQVQLGEEEERNQQQSQSYEGRTT